MRIEEEKIEHYYSLKPISFPILIKFELKQNVIAGETPTLDVSVVMRSRDKHETKSLNLFFEGVRELRLSQPSLSEFHIPFIKIDSIKDSQWEDLTYKVKDEEESTFSFLCKNFEVDVC
jgi:hypothetical protein